MLHSKTFVAELGFDAADSLSRERNFQGPGTRNPPIPPQISIHAHARDGRRRVVKPARRLRRPEGVDAPADPAAHDVVHLRHRMPSRSADLFRAFGGVFSAVSKKKSLRVDIRFQRCSCFTRVHLRHSSVFF